MRCWREWPQVSERPTRKELGQWFTPEPVVDLALSLVLPYAGKTAQILDPSCGDGVFLRRALCLGVDEERLTGVDIDADAIGQARAQLPRATLLHRDFFDVEAMELPLADVIVGNPPYVRQERIGADGKERIVTSLMRDWPTLGRDTLASLVGRSDLAAPFVLHLLRHLAPGGVAALVLSSAFFDSAYGAEFWRLAEQVASLRLVVDAPAERWFEDAAVHTVIALFDAAPSDVRLRLARLKEPTVAVAAKMVEGASLAQVADIRETSRKDRPSWVAALRASAAWLEFADLAQEHLVPLGELARVRRGMTSGANEIFYLTQAQAGERRLEPGFLQPLLTARGRGRQGAILIEPGELKQHILMVGRDCQLDEYPVLQRYLASFTDAPARRTLRNREPWWSLQTRPSNVFLCKAYGERFAQPFSDLPLLADQRMYCLHPISDVDPELLSALLNATPTSLALESLGRASMGQGALEWTVADVATLPVLDIRRHPNPAGLLACFAKLRVRCIGTVASEAGMQDRRALDRMLLTPWPTLAAMRERLSDALVASCAARKARAMSKVRS